MLTRMARMLTDMLTRMTRWLAYYTHSSPFAGSHNRQPRKFIPIRTHTLG